MKKQIRTAIITILSTLILSISVLSFWRTPITKYKPKSADETEISHLFIKYITSRNNHDKKRFLSTLHDDCKYMVTKDVIATKDELKTMLPELWMQNEDGNAAFGRCMAWECWHENYYKKVMLINPIFRISKDRAYVEFKIVSGLFMDDNYFNLVKENNYWLISEFSRPIQ